MELELFVENSLQKPTPKNPFGFNFNLKYI